MAVVSSMQTAPSFEQNMKFPNGTNEDPAVASSGDRAVDSTQWSTKLNSFDFSFSVSCVPRSRMEIGEFMVKCHDFRRVWRWVLIGDNGAKSSRGRRSNFDTR
ncbi:hypothetical protein L1887_30462 [Cichorium endivia]|nr:hypothetical protein L1887_30462 [Cichorium endivia]